MREEIIKFWPQRESSALVIIDVQQRLVPSMPVRIYKRVLESIDMLAKGAGALHLPTVITEQYPRGLGETVTELQHVIHHVKVEKLSFGCCGEPAFLERLERLHRKQVVVVGMEAHVCVYQTVLGLLERGYQVHLVRDAICSRNKPDYLNALELAAAAGAIVTTAETILFQWLLSSGASEFKTISALVKQRSSDSS